MPRAKARRLPRERVLTAGPFVGMDDAPEPVASNPQLVAMARNIYLPPFGAGGAYLGRPGITLTDAQLGSSSQRTAQWIGQYTESDGTEHTVMMLYGQLYEYTWGTDSWDIVVTAANFVTASITVSATAKVRGMTFGGQLHLSDGVNVPFFWDGSSGAGGLTELTDSPVLYGQPWVRAVKVMGIKAAERPAIVWSEEGDAETGYEAGGFTNAWTVPNRWNQRLVAGVATNSAITLFWESSASVILGSTNEDWTSANTTPAVSSTLGTLSPDAALGLDEGVLFVDQHGRPHLIPDGASEPVPLYERCQTALSSINRSALGNILAIEDRATHTVKIGYPDGSETYASKWLVYTRDAGRLVFTGIETGYTAQVAGMVKDANGRWVWMHAGADDGYVYVHGTPKDGPWSDMQGTSTVAIQRDLHTMPLAPDPDVEMVIDQVTLQAYGSGTQTLSVAVRTPRGDSPAQTLALSGSGAQFGSAQFGSAEFSGGSADRRGRLGFLRRGRWAQVLVSQGTMGQQFGLELGRVVAFDDGAEPAIP